ILSIVAEGDYITPPESSLALSALAGSTDHEVVRLPGGHIGLSTGRAAHEKLWPRVAAWVQERDRTFRDRAMNSPNLSDRIKKSPPARAPRRAAGAAAGSKRPAAPRRAAASKPRRSKR